MLFIAAPVLMFAYGIIRILDGLDGSRGPGLAWTTGHLAFLAALALFIPILWRLHRLATTPSLATRSFTATPAPSTPPPPATSARATTTPSPTATSIASTASAASAVIATLGALALIVQFGIDIVVGLLATDKAHMSTLFDRVQAVPALTPIVYTAGPYLFYIGLFALSVLARRGVWLPILVGVNTVLPLISKDLIPLAAVCLLLAFWPLRTPTPRMASATAVSP